MTAKILIVDDAPSSAILMSTRMEGEYFETLTAGDGVEALRVAREWRPDLVLLDVMMPCMDGFEACRQLKAEPETAHLPVVMVTALDALGDRLRGLEAGADEFLTKPVDRETLLARLKGLLRLKRLSDEWRTRVETMRSLGLGTALTTDPAGEKPSALIVADWELGVAAVRDTLAGDGIATTLARGTDAATEAFADAEFDLVIIDLALVTGDPLRLVSRLRADERTRDIPILALAGAADRQLVVRAFNVGVNDWVTRPLDRHELTLRARNQIRRRLYQRRLREDFDRALALAVSDPLTDLPNRHYLLNYLDKLAEGGQSAPVAALYIDLDHFKRVNDRFGHEIGDDALRLVAAAMRKEIRAANLAARYGGEEFVVILPGANAEQAMAAAERLRAAVVALVFRPEGAAAPFPLTVSIGVAAAEAGWTDGRALLRRADQALYVAKEKGRNRVELDSTAPATP